MPPEVPWKLHFRSMRQDLQTMSDTVCKDPEEKAQADLPKSKHDVSFKLSIYALLYALYIYYTYRWHSITTSKKSFEFLKKNALNDFNLSFAHTLNLALRKVRFNWCTDGVLFFSPPFFFFCIWTQPFSFLQVSHLAALPCPIIQK